MKSSFTVLRGNESGHFAESINAQDVLHTTFCPQSEESLDEIMVEEAPLAHFNIEHDIIASQFLRNRQYTERIA